MRKSLVGSSPVDAKPSDEALFPEDLWLDLQQIATVQITSEDPLFPIEHALGPAQTSGWRASSKGPQVIRLTFDQPTAVRRILLHFVDSSAERSQEFSIYAGDSDGHMHEVVRQQFTFSAGGATEETEDFSVRLPAVVSLELRIDPDRAHDPTHSQHFALLQSLRVA